MDRKLDRANFFLSEGVRIRNLENGRMFAFAASQTNFSLTSEGGGEASPTIPPPAPKPGRLARACVRVRVECDSLTLCTRADLGFTRCGPAAAPNRVGSDLCPLSVPGIASDCKKTVPCLAETSWTTAKLSSFALALGARRGGLEDKRQSAETVVNTFDTNGTVPLFLIRKTLLLTVQSPSQV